MALEVSFTLRWARRESSIIVRAQRFNKTSMGEKLFEGTLGGISVWLFLFERGSVVENTQTQRMFALTETVEINKACDNWVKSFKFSQEQLSQLRQPTVVTPWNRSQTHYQIFSQLLFQLKLVSIRSDALLADPRSDIMCWHQSVPLLSTSLWWDHHYTCSAYLDLANYTSFLQSLWSHCCKGSTK